MTRPTLPPGVKATSGGTYDPDAHLLYFIAGGPERVQCSDYEGHHMPEHPNVLVAVNELGGRGDLSLLDELCDKRRVLLDSGVFNLAMSHAREHGLHMDDALTMPPEEVDGFSELWDNYARIATTFADRLWGVVELDQGGIENKPRVRARIEAELGVIPMPVYHPLLDGWDYYDDLAGGYDRICFGNLVKAAPPVRVRLIHTASERARRYPYLWTHLLGVYPNENVLAIPLRGSCDSSSWLTSVRWMPSWKGSSLAKMVTHYPPAFWYRADSYQRAEAVNHITALAMDTMLGDLIADTHPWLDPTTREALHL